MRTALSKSRLAALGCLRHFKALYIDKVEVPKGQPAMVGGLTHEVIEAFLLALKEHPPYEATPQSRKGLMRDLVTAGWNKRGEGEFSALGMEHLDRIEAMLLPFAEATTLGPDFFGAETQVAVNEAWELVPWYDPTQKRPAFFRGIMDRLDVSASGIVTVTDYKTAWRIDNQDEIERGPEVRSYAALIKAVLPEAMVIRVRVVFLRFWAPPVVREVEVHPDVIDSARARIVSESNRLEAAKKANVWPATPGALCEFCPVFNDCPARNQALPNRPPETNEEAVDLLRSYVLLTRQRGEIAGRLAAWVAANGPLVSDGLRAHYRTDERVTYRMEEMMEVLRQHGLNPHLFINPDNRKIDAKAGKDPSIEAALAPLRTVRPHSTWAVQNDKGDE